MLISIAATLNIKRDHINMAPAATVYPFLNSKFRLPDDLVPVSYPFVAQSNMLLIGDCQYGGQRTWYPEGFSVGQFKGQLLLGPEDCSSALGKATGFTNQVYQKRLL